MAKAQTLTTNIVINARAGSGFAQVGNTLTELGSIVNQFSQKIFQFGKESIDVYRGYEKSMKQAEVALATTYDSATELSSVMKILDGLATQWAASTIFHTDDVGNAIAEAARAGWDLKQITAGMPASMRLAQAGSLDLSTAVDYIVKATNAAGIEFDDLTTFIDEWTYAANSSATTVDEMGEAMIRMGATMSFADSQEEIFTLLASLANVGYVGTEAGTLLRNAMLRLAAPTQKAADAMSTLEMTQDEFEEIMADSELLAATEALQTMGFTAYDAEGNLRPMVSVYKDLSDALKGMSEQDANQILSAIFPSRTLAGARSLINAAAEGYDGLYQSLMQGDANGYSQFAAETMMDTLDGSIETFLSKTERLKQVVGGALSDDVRGFLDGMGGFIDSVAEMDPDKLDAVVSGVGTFAAVGPGLMLAGTALRFLANPLGIVAVSAAGLIGLIKYLDKMDTARFKDNFGDLDLDPAAMTQYVQDLGSVYETTYQQVDSFSSALDTAVTSYQTASQEFSSGLLTAAITKQNLTPQDIAKFEGLGRQMKQSVLNGIGSSADANAAFVERLFGVKHGESSTNTAYNDIISTSAAWYQEAYSNALEIGEGLTEAMNAAFADGELSTAERENIMNYVADYNAAISEAQREWQDLESRATIESMLWDSQNMSLDSALSTSQQFADMRDAQVGDLTSNYYHDAAFYKAQKEKQIESATTKSEQVRLQAEMNVALAAFEKAYQNEKQGIMTRFNEANIRLFDSLLSSSDVSEGYKFLTSLGQAVVSGNMTSDDAYEQYYVAAYGKDATINPTDLRDSLVYAVESLGGFESAREMFEYNKSIGNIDLATQIGGLLEAYKYATDYVDYTIGSSIFGEQYVQSQGALNSQQMADLTLDTSTAEESIAQLSDSEVTVTPNANTSKARKTITSLNGTPIVINVDADFSQFYTGLATAQNSASIVMGTINRMATFAEGGRATEASIFGEAGAEWAIPEEHSQRTADLLAQAASASGFTWPELLGLTGGLNASVNSRPTTIVYSPTINAGDSRGVESALRRDKENLLRLLAEQRMIGEMEAYS